MAKYFDKLMSQQIVSAIKEVCGQDINFIDTKGFIIASTNSLRVGEFHEVGYKVVNTKEIIEVYSFDKFQGTREGINAPIIFEGDVVAVIGITGNPKEVKKYINLAIRIAVLIVHENKYYATQKVHTQKINYLINSLVNSDLSSKDYLDKIILEFYPSLEIEVRVAIITFLKDTPSNFMENFFKKEEIYFNTFRYPNRYVCIIDKKITKDTFKTVLENNNYPAKLSFGGFENFYQIVKSYNQAELAYKTIKKTSENFASYDHLDFDMLIEDISQDIKIKYLDKTIRNLKKEDIDLLSVYYENDISLDETCKKLFLHKNTLQYKLKRIQKITSYDPRSFKDAMVLYTAIKLNEK